MKLKRNLRLEKVVSSKQLRLAVATDRRRKKNKTGSFSEKLATTVFPRLEHARSINFRLAPRDVVFEGAL